MGNQQEKFGNECTLIELLGEYEIRIPIIQRDYAQGRDTEKGKVVRENLIKEFKRCLGDEDEKEKIDFNFVYGTVSERIFYPVDGQQRLTSLYLLHWYLICCLEIEENHDLKDKFKDEIEKFKQFSFSYMTRYSASEFFDTLKSFNNELINIVKDTTDLKKDVLNKSWFQIEWKCDPTVSAALNFLKDLSINTEFKDNAELYFKRLVEKAITFTFIHENTESNAESNAAKNYIRMNARGKVLEPFENLKAMIDTIESKIKEEDAVDDKTLIKEYDHSYINALYNSQNENEDLNKKTTTINKMSTCCFKNIYNLCVQLSDLDKQVIAKESIFISTIYGESQNDNLETEFYKNYFECIKAVFEYYCEYTDEASRDKIQEIWEDKKEFKVDDNRECVAVILYIYYYGARESKPIVGLEQIEQYLYVLNNLKYQSWKNPLRDIFDFSREISREEDAFKYFSEDRYFNGNEGFGIKDSGLNDIEVRIEEQRIKAKIIIANSEDIYYFKVLEEKTREEKTQERKIQYLLYISGYWENYNQGSYKVLDKYKQIAEEYFHAPEGDEKSVEWLKIYAIATNINMAATTGLKAAGEINENDKLNDHIWKDDFYYWNDEDDVGDKKQLQYIKRAYENLEGIKKIKKNIEDMDCEIWEAYKTCWLMYAVKYANNERKDFLTKELKLIGDVVYIYSLKAIRYDKFVLEKIKVLKKGFDTLKPEVALFDFTFEKTVGYETELGDKKYAVADSVGTYNMHLKANVEIIGVNENHKEKDEMCLHEKKGAQYSIYVFDESELYQYKKHEYKLADEINFQQIRKEDLKTIFEAYGEREAILLYNKFVNNKDEAWPENKEHQFERISNNGRTFLLIEKEKENSIEYSSEPDIKETKMWEKDLENTDTDE